MLYSRIHSRDLRTVGWLLVEEGGQLGESGDGGGARRNDADAEGGSARAGFAVGGVGFVDVEGCCEGGCLCEEVRRRGAR